MSGGVPAGELLPCPFCGKDEYLSNGGTACHFAVVCIGCDSEGPWIEYDQSQQGDFERAVAEAHTAWNTRATPTPPIEGRDGDRLREHFADQFARHRLAALASAPAGDGVFTAAEALCNSATDDCTGERTVTVDPDSFDALNAALDAAEKGEDAVKEALAAIEQHLTDFADSGDTSDDHDAHDAAWKGLATIRAALARPQSAVAPAGDGVEEAEAVGWLVEWTVAGQDWVEAFACEVNAVDKARAKNGKCTPLYPALARPHAALGELECRTCRATVAVQDDAMCCHCSLVPWSLQSPPAKVEE